MDLESLRASFTRYGLTITEHEENGVPGLWIDGQRRGRKISQFLPLDEVNKYIQQASLQYGIPHK